MRKHYLDNIRWFIILLVLVDHTVCIFSACKSPMSYNTNGIEALDSIGYLIYPWFMPCLFVVAGMSARYAIAKYAGKSSADTDFIIGKDIRKRFIKERRRKLLIPFLAYLVLIGPFAAELSFRTTNAEETFAALPKAVIFLIRIVNGMGPAWFLIQLFLISWIFLLFLKLDKNQKLLQWGERVNIWGLLLLYIPVFLAAQVLYVAYTFRNALYLLLFLMGYYIFSHDKVQEICKKYAFLFLGAGLLSGLAQMLLYWGKAYQYIVNEPLVMLFTWFMILALLGIFGRFFDKANEITEYFTENSFGIYLFHYVPIVYIAYFLDTRCKLPDIFNYLFTFAGAFLAAVVLTELIKRIPWLNTLFGLKKKAKMNE